MNRIRGLACTLMEEVEAKIGMKINTNNTIWSWAAKHASWILNRYPAVRGATPYELVYGKPYRELLGKFGGLVYAYLKTQLKEEKKWHKALFLGKTEGQDSFIVYDGMKVLLTKSIRRLQGVQLPHLRLQEWFWFEVCANEERSRCTTSSS